MRILTLDAATPICTAGLVEGGAVLDAREAADVAELPILARAVLAGGGFGLVAVIVGPGGFTGLRASIALAQGLALAGGVEAVGVTLGTALAEGDPAFWTAVDDKRGRILLERCGRVETVKLDALPMPAGPIRIGGDAASPVVAALAARGAAVSLASRRASPSGIARAALAGATRPAMPLYVQPPAARPAPASRPPPA